MLPRRSRSSAGRSPLTTHERKPREDRLFTLSGSTSASRRPRRTIVAPARQALKREASPARTSSFSASVPRPAVPDYLLLQQLRWEERAGLPHDRTRFYEDAEADRSFGLGRSHSPPVGTSSRSSRAQSPRSPRIVDEPPNRTLESTVSGATRIRTHADHHFVAHQRSSPRFRDTVQQSGGLVQGLEAAHKRKTEGHYNEHGDKQTPRLQGSTSDPKIEAVRTRSEEKLVQLDLQYIAKQREVRDAPRQASSVSSLLPRLSSVISNFAFANAGGNSVQRAPGAARSFAASQRGTPHARERSRAISSITRPCASRADGHNVF